MSEFKFACPVCGQHISASTGASGTPLDCPTCYRKLVVPQAPTGNSKLILSATEFSAPRPASALGDAAPRTRSSSGFWPTLIFFIALVSFAGALYAYRDRLGFTAVRSTQSIGGTNASTGGSTTTTGSTVAGKSSNRSKTKSAGSATGTGGPTNVVRVPGGRTDAAPVPFQSAYPVPTNITWISNLARAVIPDAPVTGRLHGHGFALERATLQGGALMLRQGKAWPPDLGVTVQLHARQAEDLAGHTVKVAPERAPPVPRIVLRWRDESNQPVTDTLATGGYTLLLWFGQATNGFMPGKIYLALPDAEQSFVAGTFVAEIRKPTPPKPKTGPTTN